MLKSLIAILFVCLSFAFSASAIEPSDKYKQCIKSSSEESVLTGCFEQEYNRFVNEAQKTIADIKKDTYFAQILPKVSLDEQYALFQKTSASFCQNHVAVNAGQGYSDRYLMSKCLLERTVSYVEWLKSIASNAHSDMKD